MSLFINYSVENTLNRAGKRAYFCIRTKIHSRGTRCHWPKQYGAAGQAFTIADCSYITRLTIAVLAWHADGVSLYSNCLGTHHYAKVSTNPLPDLIACEGRIRPFASIAFWRTSNVDDACLACCSGVFCWFDVCVLTLVAPS